MKINQQEKPLQYVDLSALMETHQHPAFLLLFWSLKHR